MKKRQENYFIDFLRFIFSVIVMLYHSWVFAGQNESSLFNSGYLAVNFYFILTGYLMMYSLEKHNSDTKDFIKNKIKRLAPAILVTFLVCYIFIYGRNAFSMETIFSNNVISGFLLLGVTGLGNQVNASWWYLSVMLFVLFLLYPLARKFKEKYINYIVPLLIFIVLAIVNYYDISMSYHSGITIPFINGFYKGIIYICLGNVSYELSKYIRNFKLNTLKRVFITIFEYFIYIFIIINMHFNYIGTIWYAILLTLGLAISFSNKSFNSEIFKSKIWGKVGNYGFYLYLTHYSIRVYMLRRNTSVYYEMLPKYILLSLFVALFVYVILDILYPYIKKKQNLKMEKQFD